MNARNADAVLARDGRLRGRLLGLGVVGALGLSMFSSTAVGQEIREFESNAAGWRDSVNDPQVFAFDAFFPGISSKGNLTGRDISIDLGTTLLRIEELGTAGGALRDASSTAQVSDAPLYVQDGIGSRWTFSEPIYGLFTYYGSADGGNTMTMRLYLNNQLVDEISRFGGGLGIWAVGHGFVSDTPIDRIDFVTVGWDTNILIGAFVGLDVAETSLGVDFLAGYQGPNGSNVEADFGITTVPPPDFELTATTLFADQIATFALDGAVPNARAYLAYSLKGPGQTVVPGLNITLQLKAPKQAGGFVVTNGRGEAQWQLFIPRGAKGLTVWFQGAQNGGVSNVVQRSVN